MANKKKMGRGRGIEQVRRLVLQYFRNAPARTKVNYKQVASALGAGDKQAYQLVREAMELLAQERVLKFEGRGKYSFPRSLPKQTGLFRRKSGRGHNLFYPADGGAPIRVAERDSKNAMDGDTVVIHLLANRRGREPEGEVLQIVERAEATFVGVLSLMHHTAFLLTESNKLANDIYIPKDKLGGGQDGDKVLVRVIEWPERAKNPVGEVIAVLGRPGDNDTEMHAILAEFGLPYSYPEELVAYAEELDERRAYSDEYLRADFRGVPTFTIDPDDAKDFDDALSLRREGDLYEVGVHIADVTAFVLPDNPIDEEAAKRATSVYLVDRTVPMLPERLSNDLCSLRPHEDRATYSVIFSMNDQAEVLGYQITRAIIHSDERFTYDEAQAVIEGKEHTLSNEILALDRLAKQLRAKRKTAGSIEFERSELAFRLDEKGKPIEVYVKEILDANKLIEEFMLLANRTVAEHIAMKINAKRPPSFVYRVHDQPSSEHLSDLAEFVGRLGYKINHTGTPEMIAQSLNHLLASVRGKAEEELVEIMVIRTMAKAVYATDNIGHYGLAFPYYTHFTSPIRRHPDMMVHRLLTHYLAGGKSVDEKSLAEACKHDSHMEKLAADADRASVKYKQVEYMQERLGEIFNGVISGVKEFGFFVELEGNGCEGLVPIRDLDDDYYEYDERKMALVGYRYKQTYRLGDSVRVKVVRADLEGRQIDFELVEK